MSYSLHKSNLDTLINIKDYDSVMLIENSLQIDARYLKNWRYPEKIDRVSIAVKTSFYHYFNLLRLPNMRFCESSNILNDLSSDEYRINTINYLEQALEGLLRLITYYKYYHIKEYRKFEKLYENITQQIKRCKQEFGILLIISESTTSESDTSNNTITEMNENDIQLNSVNDDENSVNNYNDNNDNNDNNSGNIEVSLYLGNEVNDQSADNENTILNYNNQSNENISENTIIDDYLDDTDTNRLIDDNDIGRNDNNTQQNNNDRENKYCYTIPILTPITNFFSIVFGTMGCFVNRIIHNVDDFFYNVFN